MPRSGQVWDASSPRNWADALGLVYVPLFGSGRGKEWPGECAVLLDGQRDSFAACTIQNENPLSNERKPLSWSWSANLLHVLLLNRSTDEMLLRRWDTPDTYRRFRLPSNVSGAKKLFAEVQEAAPAKSPDVVLYLLRAFRQIRAIIHTNDANTDTLVAVRVFNAFLLGTEAVRRGEFDEREWLKCRTVGKALKLLDHNHLKQTRTEDLPAVVRNAQIGQLLDFFVRPEPMYGYRLEPDLLLRHAAGQLYQEAHLIIERDPQLCLPGLASEAAPRGSPMRRDVRITPTVLARALVQQSLGAASEQTLSQLSLDVLDPACGSGVFLQEILRELQSRKYTGKVNLRGFDISPISCEIARFCLERARRDAQEFEANIDVEIREADALKEGWGSPDLIVTNPPFVQWLAMGQDERDTVSRILGSLAKGRADKSMAFLWKATQSVREGGVVASVLPAPLLETDSGQEWREALAAQADLRLIGRFEGYGFFPAAAVEPAFVVMQRRKGGSARQAQLVKMVFAKPGAEEAAIRGLRQHPELSAPIVGDLWEAFAARPENVSSASWLPRSARFRRMIEELLLRGMPTVGQLFDVRQGVITGKNPVFLISSEELKQIPKAEQRFFRQAATNSTIKAGRIEQSCYVFYPYDETGLALKTEKALRARVPVYFARWLEPAKHDLAGRARIGAVRWWALSEERAWQRVRRAKLVTKYFGERGGFGFDADGDFVVVQGYAWFWKDDGSDADSSSPFFNTPVPWAYLGLLNSSVFEALVSCYCPRVRGGQFNLSPRFISHVFLPNLADEVQVAGDLVQELAEMGRRIHRGQWPSTNTLEEAALRAYGLPSDKAILRDH